MSFNTCETSGVDMNAKIPSEKSGWVVARAWLNAVNEGALKYLGPKNWKMFCSMVDESASKHYLRILQKEFGIRADRADSLKKAVENYIKVGVLAGLFESESDFELREEGFERLQIRVLSCPYFMREVCKDALEGGLKPEQMNCPRIGCFRAAVVLLSDIPCYYDVQKVDPGKECVGRIVKQ